MFASTLAILALAAGADLSSNHPKLQADYYQAMSRASEDNKPMAVFIGQGADTFKKMIADGKIPADATKVLNNSYVCLYVDTDSTSGKDLAGRFGMKEGLIISSPGGTLQAYRYAGNVPAETVTRELTRYASAGQPATTVAAGLESPVTTPTTGNYILTGGCANGSCGRPVSYPFYGSSCPNGRCGR